MVAQTTDIRRVTGRAVTQVFAFAIFLLHDGAIGAVTASTRLRTRIRSTFRVVTLIRAGAGLSVDVVRTGAQRGDAGTRFRTVGADYRSVAVPDLVEVFVLEVARRVHGRNGRAVERTEREQSVEAIIYRDAFQH